MRVVYDRAADTLRILLNETPIVESDETKPGVILDYDADGNIGSMEVLDASQRVLQLTSLTYEVAEHAA